MRIAKWTPFSVFPAFEKEMQAFFDRFTTVPWIDVAWRPTIDVYRDDGNLKVRAEVPGIDVAADVEVEVKDGVLTIKGEKRTAKAIEEDDRFVRESRYGSFERSIMLPPGVDPKAVTARAEHGVLIVTVPLPEPIGGEDDKVHIEVSVT